MNSMLWGFMIRRIGTRPAVHFSQVRNRPERQKTIFLPQ